MLLTRRVNDVATAVPTSWASCGVDSVTPRLSTTVSATESALTERWISSAEGRPPSSDEASAATRGPVSSSE
jgi:hypothetical protein